MQHSFHNELCHIETLFLLQRKILKYAKANAGTSSVWSILDKAQFISIFCFSIIKAYRPKSIKEYIFFKLSKTS